MPLSPNAAAFVDAQVACHAAKIGGAQLGRLIGEAIARFDPETAEKERRAAADGRHVALRFAQSGGVGMPGTEGLVQLDGTLDYADARDLEQAVRHGAADLAALGSSDSLDVRRSQAVGVMARADLTLDLNGQPDSRPDSQPTPDVPARRARRDPGPAPSEPAPGPLVRPRQVVIHAHLRIEALTGTPTNATGSTSTTTELARIPGHGSVTADQVRSWCGPDAQVLVKPVVDTTECIGVDAYEIPDRLRGQVVERDPTCVFPWCRRTATRCDIDHVTAHSAGGATCSCNLAPLCRRHHRLKTHTGWTYDTTDTADYLWTSPHGHRLRVTSSGTQLLDRTAQPQAPPADT